MTRRMFAHGCASVVLGLAIGFFLANWNATQTRADANLSELANQVAPSNSESGLLPRAAFTAHSFDLQGAPQQDKPAEQVRKNIQVLKGLPNSQLIPVMDFMSASLNVNCAYCHVSEGGNLAFEKDDKEEKIVARQMIQMVLDINRQNFNNRREVTCFTCHRGETHPVALPALPVALPRNSVGAATRSLQQQRPTVDQILDKHVAAIGGKPAFAKFKTRVWKGTQAMADGTTLPVEIYQAAPNKYATVITTPRNGTMLSGFNGTEGWVKNQRGARTLSGAPLEQLKRSADFFANVHLKDLYPQMRVVGKQKIGDREAYVIVSAVDEKTRARLYFDTETGLLLRTVTLTDGLIAWIPEQMDFEDYREVDGVKLPFTIRMSLVDSRGSWTRKFTEIKHNLAIGDANFNMPSPPPTPPK